MDNLPVTLIVKAPNQQIEDQTVKCELSWTINKLKQHLSEVYPSKPPKHEQKLIYSGQLLNDTLILKDVLRQYEGQETHTVHLVCATPKEPLRMQQQPNSIPNNIQQPQQINRSTSTPDTTVPNLQNFPWMSQLDQQYAAHIAVMQQAYIQYVNQYMQLAANQSYTQQQQQQQNEVQEQEPVVQQQQQQQREDNERDWLDNFYAISRLLVLFSVVYFYSSFLRFSLVLILGLIMYLYQIGFFRHINNNNNNNIENAGVEQEEQQPSRLTIVWTFFTTFFASLLPEVPNAV